MHTHAKVPRILVESTMIRAVGYWPAEFILEVEFRNRYHGHVWQYTGVPPYIPMEFMRAKSKGCYYLNSVKGRWPAQEAPEHQQFFLSPEPGRGFTFSLMESEKPQPVDVWPAAPDGAQPGTKEWAEYWREKAFKTFPAIVKQSIGVAKAVSPRP